MSQANKAEDNTVPKMEPHKTISLDGYLGDDMPAWIDNIRGENADWFKHCTDVNRFGEELANHITARTVLGDVASVELLLQLLLVRSLSNFQGVILLAERGMIIESATLARSILENTMYALALKENEQLMRVKIEAAHYHYVEKFGQSLLSLKVLDTKREAELRAYLNSVKAENKSYVSVKDIADMIKLEMKEALYPLYNALSANYAHPTIASLNIYLGIYGGEGKQLNAMPRTDVSDMLTYSAMNMIGLYATIIDRFKIEGFKERCDELLIHYSELEERTVTDGPMHIDPVLLPIKPKV